MRRSIYMMVVSFAFMCFGVGMFFSQSFAVISEEMNIHNTATEHSLDFLIEGTGWLNDGKPIHFDGEKNRKNITGKLYPLVNEDKVPGTGYVYFLFYDSKDKPVFSESEIINENPEQQPFLFFDLQLDHRNLKGDYKVKVVARHSVAGWLNY